MDSAQRMASSSSAVPSSERTSLFSSQTEIEMESSKSRHWSQLDYSTSESELSAETNPKYFRLLKENPEWGRFFTDFETLEVGEKISEGAQADIYEARNTGYGPFDLVVKVIKGDVPLKAFGAQWPIGMLSARSKYKHLFDLPLISILGGTMLRDERLQGRFAFVMYRRWGDLRLLIDRRMKQERSTAGPFPIDEAIHLMLSIAEDMNTLHNKHDIVHRDLKASNVLVWGEFGEDMRLVATPNRVTRIGSVVADFECSVGVLGTRSWMAPEILEQLKDSVPRSKVLLTRASDVYSYGVTCYEIVTGCIPYDGCGGKDIISQILQGRRPELPHDLPEFVRNIIVGCWHSNPLDRPSFSNICMALKLKTTPNPIGVVIDNKSQRGESIVKVEKWNNPQAMVLLEAMQKLVDMDLSVLKASESSSRAMIMQYFEVTDCKGKKIVKDESIANIAEALLSNIQKRECISESLGLSIDGNSCLQMHVVEVVAECKTSLLDGLSNLFVEMNFRVHSAGCSTREGRVECVMYVEGARLFTLLWELQQSRENFPISAGRFKMMIRRVAAEEFSCLNKRLHELKSMDLTLPRSSSNIGVYLRKSSGKGFRSTKVIVCLENRRSLKNVSLELAHGGYGIVGAIIKYLCPYEFLKGRVTKSEDIDVGPFREGELRTIVDDIEGEMRKIDQILDIASERGCPEVKMQLIVSGPNMELHRDLMRSLSRKDRVVSGGQVYREFDTGLASPGYLEFFVTEEPAAKSD